MISDISLKEMHITSTFPWGNNPPSHPEKISQSFEGRWNIYIILCNFNQNLHQKLPMKFCFCKLGWEIIKKIAFYYFQTEFFENSGMNSTLEKHDYLFLKEWIKHCSFFLLLIDKLTDKLIHFFMFFYKRSKFFLKTG